LPGTNALVLEGFGSLLSVCPQEPGHVSYPAGCGSGLMTGSGLIGALLGGGGRAGSSVGPTGWSSGPTVYRLTGWPICAMRQNSLTAPSLRREAECRICPCNGRVPVCPVVRGAFVGRVRPTSLVEAGRAGVGCRANGPESKWTWRGDPAERLQ